MGDGGWKVVDLKLFNEYLAQINSQWVIPLREAVRKYVFKEILKAFLPRSHDDTKVHEVI